MKIIVNTLSWHRLRLAFFAVIAIIILALALWQPWDGPLEPQTVLARTYDTVSTIQSYKNTLTASIVTGPDGEFTEHRMEVKFSAPDRYHVLLNDDGEIREYIFIGKKRYAYHGDGHHITDLVTLSTPGMTSFLRKETTLDILNTMTDIEVLPEVKIDETDCFHYTGVLDIEKYAAKVIADLAEASEESSTPDLASTEIENIIEAMRKVYVEYELWIGKDDYLIRKMSVNQEMPDSPDGTGSISINMTVEYSGINQPVTIEPPFDAEGQFLPGWGLEEHQPPPPNPEEKYFSFNMTHSIGAQEGYDDWAHQQLKFNISITNRSAETLKVTRVIILSQVPVPGEPTPYEVEPDKMNFILAPNENHRLYASLPFDATDLTKEEIIAMDNKTFIIVHFVDEDGQPLTEFLYPDNFPYPSATPSA